MFGFCNFNQVREVIATYQQAFVVVTAPVPKMTRLLSRLTAPSSEGEGKGGADSAEPRLLRGI